MVQKAENRRTGGQALLPSTRRDGQNGNPGFHSRQLTHAYEDVYEATQYVDFLRERLAFLHRILAEDGSIYVHIDDKMLFHVKLVMDEIFGSANYKNCITRKKCNPKNYTRNKFWNIADYILFYTKSDKYTWNRQFDPWTTERAKEYRHVEPDTGRHYMKVPLHAPGIRQGETGKPWRGKLPPPDKHWQFLPSKLDEFNAKGEIVWSKSGNPRRKVYLDQSGGIPVQDIWTEFRDAHNQNIHITGYPTEKNFDLLRRIIQASSDPGDIVLDCFAGSGTALVAADILERNWIGVDNSAEAVKTMLHRFAHGTKPMGDFVTRNQQSEAPTLFALSPPRSARGQGEDGHRVRGFSVLTTPDEAVVLAQILRQVGASVEIARDVEDTPHR